jgi:hypothetical protein
LIPGGRMIARGSGCNKYLGLATPGRSGLLRCCWGDAHRRTPIQAKTTEKILYTHRWIPVTFPLWMLWADNDNGLGFLVVFSPSLHLGYGSWGYFLEPIIDSVALLCYSCRSFTRWDYPLGSQSLLVSNSRQRYQARCRER